MILSCDFDLKLIAVRGLNLTELSFKGLVLLSKITNIQGETFQIIVLAFQSTFILTSISFKFLILSPEVNNVLFKSRDSPCGLYLILVPDCILEFIILPS